MERRIPVGKKYVDVLAEFTKEGLLIPRQINWEDGRKFTVERVLDMRRAASRSGGCGMRYTCLICGQRKYLFYEDNRLWFVDAG